MSFKKLTKQIKVSNRKLSTDHSNSTLQTNVGGGGCSKSKSNRIKYTHTHAHAYICTCKFLRLCVDLENRVTAPPSPLGLLPQPTRQIQMLTHIYTIVLTYVCVCVLHELCVTSHFGAPVRVAMTWRMSNPIVGMKPLPLPWLSATHSIIKLQAHAHTHISQICFYVYVCAGHSCVGETKCRQISRSHIKDAAYALTFYNNMQTKTNILQQIYFIL